MQKKSDLPYIHSESGGAGSSRGDRHVQGNSGVKRKRESSKGAGKSAGKGAGKGSGKGKGKRPKKDGNLFITTSEDEEICFQFAKHGNCEGACPQRRAHVCMLCLQPHRNANCTKKA